MAGVPEGFDLLRTYVVLHDGGRADTIALTPDFWDTIDQRRELEHGRLVAVFPYDADWSTWEMHPNGDELVVLLSGAVDMVLEVDGHEKTVALRGNEGIVVPAGVWHRAVVHRSGAALHLTRGSGTEHRPV